MKADATTMSLLNDSVLQQPQQDQSITTHREVYFRSGKIVAVNVNLFRGTKKSVKERSIKNLELKGTSLGIKQGTCSKLEKMLTTWIKCLHYKNLTNKELGLKGGRLPVFITLTLPAQQLHADTQIKRDILMPFLQNLKRSLCTRYYFWKAEVQKNGNIHFHLIIDQYIKKEYLTSLWNYHCETLNYVTRFERKHGHTCPPSTHVEKIEDIRKATSYVLKYVNKDVEGRNIEGRKWDCSKELKNLKLTSYLEDDQISNYLTWLINNEKATMYNDEFFSVYRFTERFDYDRDYFFIRQREQAPMLYIYQDLYMRSEKTFLKSQENQVVEESTPTQLRLFDDNEGKKIDWTMY